MATAPPPQPVSVVRISTSIETAQPVRSAMLMPGTDVLLTLEGTHWIPRRLADAQPYPGVAATPCESTEQMWSDRVSSPDGAWQIALDGQSVEVRPISDLSDRRHIEFVDMPKLYAFFRANPNLLILAYESGQAEVWDLPSNKLVTASPIPAAEAAGITKGSSPKARFLPASASGAVTLQLSTQGATLLGGGGGAAVPLHPVGRRQVAGGAISADGSTVLLATGGPPTPLTACDPWTAGELFLYGANGACTGAAMHAVESAKPPRVFATPTLSHVFLLTAEGGLVCVEAGTGRVVWAINYSPGATAATFSADGSWCFAGFAGGEIVAMAGTPTAEIWRQRPHEFAVSAVALSRDARYGVTVGADRQLLTWDVPNATPLTGAPPRYNRNSDAYAVAADIQGGPAALLERLGPEFQQVLVEGPVFALDFGGQLLRFPINDLQQSTVLWPGGGAPAPDATGYIVAEMLPPDPKKGPQLGLQWLSLASGQRTPVAALSVPSPDVVPPHRYLAPNRILMPDPKGGVMLARLDKSLFGATVKLDIGALNLTALGVYTAIDGSAFAIANGAEVHVFKTDDGKRVGELIIEAPRRPNLPAAIGVWVAPGGTQVATFAQSGTLARWKLA